MKLSREYEAWLAAALRETDRRGGGGRQERAMRDEPPRDEAGTPAGDTSGAAYLADDDRTKTTGDNAVPHRHTPTPLSRHVPRVRREAGQRLPKAIRAAEEE